MKVEIAFCSDALARRGYSVEHAERTVRRAFGRFGQVCTVGTGGLTVYGRGDKDDFANLWRVLMALLRSDWFPDCAAKCAWYDDDGTSEDVLAQAWKLKNRYRSLNLSAILPKGPAYGRHWGQGSTPASGVLTSKRDACDNKKRTKYGVVCARPLSRKTNYQEKGAENCDNQFDLKPDEEDQGQSIRAVNIIANP